MKVILRGVHLNVSPSMRAYLDKHLVRPLARFYDAQAAQLEVHLVDVNGPKGGADKECRVTMRMPRHRDFHVVEAGRSLYQCVDVARDRVERLVKRELERSGPQRI